MSWRTRTPGPVLNACVVGNLSELNRDGASRWISLDPTSDGWTFNDPGSTGTVKSVTTGSSGIRVQLEIDNNSERFNHSSQNGGRYYKKLIGPYGPLTWADNFSIEFLVEKSAVGANNGDAGNGSQWTVDGFALGIADSSCVADTSDVEWTGVTCHLKSNNGTLQANIGGDTNLSSITDNDSVKLYACLGCMVDDDDAGDTNPVIHRGFGYLLNTDGDLVTSNGMSQQTHEFTRSDDVYLLFAPSFGGSISGSDTDATWKVWYRIHHSIEGLYPTYYPGGEAASG